MRTPKFRDTHIGLAHGNGGRFMRELIEEIFAPALANPQLDTGADAVALPMPADRDLMVTTDGFTVQPLEFPGGNIGSLAVHGTVNDLAVSGAVPRYLTLSVFLEEGLEIAVLRRVVQGLASAARDSGVHVVAGDTKVVGRGDCDGIYLAATGIGFGSSGVPYSSNPATFPRDIYEVLFNPLPFNVPDLHFMRDPTRGGLATVAHEVARATGFSVRLSEAHIPVNDAVQSVCELLGFDPLYLACEGRIVAVVGRDGAAAALAALREVAPQAALIGEIGEAAPQVVLTTAFGGERSLDELEEDPLPRIC